jgi:RNA-directed DNA polymerase
VHLVRYADDFIITGASREVLENEVRPLVEQFMAERGLRLSPDKTRITQIHEGFDFLGQNLRKFGGKLLIKPSKKNTQVFLEKVRTIMRENQAASQEKLIRALNQVILGWVNYHRHIVASQTFARVDHEIWCGLWRWAKHRHHNKSSAWVAKKYWHSIEGRSWRFAVNTGKQTADGRPIWFKLVCANKTIIRRHLKIKGEANPFDPKWRRYFEERKFFKKFGIHRSEAGIHAS